MKHPVSFGGLNFCYLIFLVAAFPVSTASAGMIIEIRDTSIAAGQPGTLDVLISSNSGDALALANYAFQITNVGTPAGTLEFADPHPVTSNLDPSYVFATDLDPAGLFINSQTTADLEAGDFTNSGTGITLTASPKLLFRLDLLHVLGPGQTEALAVGEQFEISLVQGAGTFFLDELGNDLTLDLGASKLTGTVTVSDVTAVPEPSSIIMTALGLSGFLSVTRKRRRKAESKANQSLPLT